MSICKKWACSNVHLFHQVKIYTLYSWGIQYIILKLSTWFCSTFFDAINKLIWSFYKNTSLQKKTRIYQNLFKIYFFYLFINIFCIPESINTPAFWLQNNLCELTALEHKNKNNSEWKIGNVPWKQTPGSVKPPSYNFFDWYNRKGCKCCRNEHTAPRDHWERRLRAKVEIALFYMGRGGEWVITLPGV